ncbi:hypothetical protein VTN77DRAFT_7873 [Rasamsonia byssochlamydoides]|uniref:uncharacterized protein n=1 Tax=Rasamsonia byssochlamydoides TaxID=89139 RepID=UPI0037430B84
MAMMSTATMNPPSQSLNQATELLWQDALRHLRFTNNEILLPANIVDLIGHRNVEEIKARLCALLRAPVVGFVDDSMNSFRIMRSPCFTGSVSDAASHILVPMLATENQKITVEPEKKGSGKKSACKKAKIPRPPNAFILYRQHNHPIVKEAHPEFHNNDISVILGKQWNNEPEHVKAHFKALADEIKRKHAEGHPDYQYSPRKPSEKKRRISSRRSTGNDHQNTYQDEHVPLPAAFPEIADQVTITETETDDTTPPDESLVFVPISEPPALNYNFMDFNIDEFEDWEENAEDAQGWAAFREIYRANNTHVRVNAPQFSRFAQA